MPPLFVCEGGRRRVAVRLDLSGTAVPALLAKESQEEKGTEESCPQGEASVWH